MAVPNYKELYELEKKKNSDLEKKIAILKSERSELLYWDKVRKVKLC